jgi:hypothetical protein
MLPKLQQMHHLAARRFLPWVFWNPVCGAWNCHKTVCEGTRRQSVAKICGMCTWQNVQMDTCRECRSSCPTSLWLFPRCFTDCRCLFVQLLRRGSLQAAQDRSLSSWCILAGLGALPTTLSGCLSLSFGSPGFGAWIPLGQSPSPSVPPSL